MFFWQVIRIFDFLSLSNDSRYLQSEPLKHFGPGALMSKLDLSDAFRHVLVHDGDWELLGSTRPVEIDGTVVTGYFFDTFLPFGLGSSPVLFLKFVDGLKFVMSSKGAPPIWNYLDDFWTCDPPSPAPHCQNSLDVMLKMCGELGFKTNLEKNSSTEHELDPPWNRIRLNCSGITH